MLPLGGMHDNTRMGSNSACAVGPGKSTEKFETFRMPSSQQSGIEYASPLSVLLLYLRGNFACLFLSLHIERWAIPSARSRNMHTEPLLSSVTSDYFRKQH
jgi:hypothetical protein